MSVPVWRAGGGAGCACAKTPFARNPIAPARPIAPTTNLRRLMLDMIRTLWLLRRLVYRIRMGAAAATDTVESGDLRQDHGAALSRSGASPFGGGSCRSCS